MQVVVGKSANQKCNIRNDRCHYASPFKQGADKLSEMICIRAQNAVKSSD
jgi:hypothetical protein